MGPIEKGAYRNSWQHHAQERNLGLILIQPRWISHTDVWYPKINFVNFSTIPRKNQSQYINYKSSFYEYIVHAFSVLGFLSALLLLNSIIEGRVDKCFNFNRLRIMHASYATVAIDNFPIPCMRVFSTLFSQKSVLNAERWAKSFTPFSSEAEISDSVIFDLFIWTFEFEIKLKIYPL